MQWKTEKRKIDDLLPAGYNPRQLSETQKELLKESVNKFNLADPIIINSNNTIIGGHQRIKVLKELGFVEIDVRIPDRELTEDEEKELNLRLNKNTGEWDYILLAKFDEGLLSSVGFSPEELDDIFKIDSEPEKKDDKIPSERETNIVLGDMFQLGDHRLLCGDATKIDDVEKLMNGDKADMVFTDPPYNVDYHGGMGAHERSSRDPILNDKMESNAFYTFLLDSIANMINVTEGAMYICMGSKELHALRLAFEEAGGHWQNYIIWVKNQFTLSRSDYQHRYEPILYGWPADKVNHYFKGMRDIDNIWEDIREVKTKFEDGFTTIKFQGFQVKIKGKVEGEISRKNTKTDIWRYDKPGRSKQHPTMKPVALILEALSNSSKRDGIVLDLFGGSGSTLIACEKTNRKCRMMELDPVYCQVIIDRWEEFTGNKVKKL